MGGGGSNEMLSMIVYPCKATVISNYILISTERCFRVGGWGAENCLSMGGQHGRENSPFLEDNNLHVMMFLTTTPNARATDGYISLLIQDS